MIRACGGVRPWIPAGRRRPDRLLGHVHAVVGVYSTDQHGFNRQGLASPETLGVVAGFALDATRRECLLEVDRVVELTLDTGGSELRLVDDSTDTGPIDRLAEVIINACGSAASSLSSMSYGLLPRLQTLVRRVSRPGRVDVVCITRATTTRRSG